MRWIWNPFTNNFDAVQESSVYIATTKTAAVPVGGLRVVTVDDSGELVYASADNPDHIERPMWITKGAIAGGASGLVIAFGEIEEPGWAWTPGESLYLALTGFMSHIPPTSPSLFNREVARIIEPTKILFDPAVSFVLA